MKRLFAVLALSAFVLRLMGDEPIRPLPQNVQYDRGKALLGRQLFTDPILSRDRSIACVTCHNFAEGGADTRPVSVGVNGSKGHIQSPTVYNARYNFKQFWNGRADSLEEQANGPIHNPLEMGMETGVVEARLNGDPAYRARFLEVYGTQSIDYMQVIDAIAEFEKALVTPNSLFDRYLRGEATLTSLQMKGYQRFKAYGCVTCHNGINIGGNSFQKMGLFVPYKHDERVPDRFAVTRDATHKNVYKVPTLRNIALTPPYFHDASAATLTEAVKTMSYHNLGTNLSEEDVEAIVAFLKTLTGEKPKVLE